MFSRDLGHRFASLIASEQHVGVEALVVPAGSDVHFRDAHNPMLDADAATLGGSRELARQVIRYVEGDFHCFPPS